jgi:hypothetical protein
VPPVYKEIAPSPAPELYENAKGQVHLRCTCHFLVDWDDVNDMCAWLYSEEGSQYRDIANCVVRRIKTLSRGEITGVATEAGYSEAILQVYYSTEGPVWISGYYADEEMLPHSMTIRPPADARLQWGSEKKSRHLTTDEMAIGIPIIGWCHILSVERALTAPVNPGAYMGLTNASTKFCYRLPYSFAPQTVLYCPPIVRAHTDFTTGTRYAYTYRHLINEKNWNKFYNRDTQEWSYLYLKGEIFYQYLMGW